MKTSPVSSSLGEFLGQAAASTNRPDRDGVTYQQVADRLTISATDQKSPTTASAAPETSQIAEPSLPPCPVGESAYRPSADPIWDTGWEIEPNEPELGQAAMDALRGLFSKNGLGDDAVKLSYIEELAVCPGVRSWVNRSVVVEYPNGQLEKFSAEWTQKRPEWTLCSMLERMGAEGPVQVVT